VSEQKPFSSISTEELEKLIGDLILEKNADYELIDELLEEYGKREGVPEIDVDAAWERFVSDYSGQDEIYLTEDADNPPQTNNIEITKTMPRGKGRRLLQRGIAAALIIIFAFVSTTIAIGVSRWQKTGQWTSEIFWFTTLVAPLQMNEALIPLHDALQDHGITSRVAPKWIPDGFVLVASETFETPIHVTFWHLFEYSSKSMTVQIIAFDDLTHVNYEMVDEGEGDSVSVYRRSGIDHFIMDNRGKVSIKWTHENYECYIVGDFTVIEAENIINSVYER